MKYEILSEEILKSDEVSWAGILETEDYEELVYKLELKYLQQKNMTQVIIKFQELSLKP